MLDAEVVLHHIGSGPVLIRVVRYDADLLGAGKICRAGAARKHRSVSRRAQSWNWNCGHSGLWRIEHVRALIHGGREFFMEYPEPSADGSLMVAKWVIGESDAR